MQPAALAAHKVLEDSWRCQHCVRTRFRICTRCYPCTQPPATSWAVILLTAHLAHEIPNQGCTAGCHPPQVASCHFLADNYSTVLGACFEGPDGEEQCIHQMGGGLQVGRLMSLGWASLGGLAGPHILVQLCLPVVQSGAPRSG